MATTYDKIATTTLGSAATNITFSSIPATYTDLRLVFVGTGTSSVGLYGRFNNDSGSNYSFTELFGQGSGAFSSRLSNLSYIDLESQRNLSTTIPVLKILDVFSYAGSTFKTSLYSESFDQDGSGVALSMVHLWRSTSAINEIKLYVNSSTIAAGSTATLYGILKA